MGFIDKFVSHKKTIVGSPDTGLDHNETLKELKNDENPYRLNREVNISLNSSS